MNTDLQHGETLFAQGKPDEARAFFAAYLELHPEAKEAWNDLGVVCAFLGEMEEAERALARALAADPHYLEARLNLAGCLESSGRPEEAALNLEKAVEAALEVRRRQAQALGQRIDERPEPDALNDAGHPHAQSETLAGGIGDKRIVTSLCPGGRSAFWPPLSG